jgi:hypothetical protein
MRAEAALFLVLTNPDRPAAGRICGAFSVLSVPLWFCPDQLPGFSSRWRIYRAKISRIVSFG